MEADGGAAIEWYIYIQKKIMQEAGNAVRRKIAGKNAVPSMRDDVEIGYMRASDTSSSKSAKYKNPYTSEGEKGRGCFGSLTCTIVLLLGLFVLCKLDMWYVSTPTEIKFAQLQVLDEEVIKFARIMKEEEERLYGRLSSVSEARNQHQEALFDIEVEHGEKVEALKGIADAGEEVSKLKKEIEKLDREKKEATKKLEDEIQKSEKELFTLHNLIDNLTVDPSRFCHNCDFKQGDLKTTCGVRLKYIMRKHDDTSTEQAMHGIIETDPNCLEKKWARSSFFGSQINENIFVSRQNQEDFMFSNKVFPYLLHF